MRTPAAHLGRELLQHRFCVLLGALALLLLVLPFMRAFSLALDHSLPGNLSRLLFVAVLLSALFAVSRTHTTVAVAVGLLAMGRLLDVVRLAHDTVPLATAADALDVAFLLLCLGLIVRRLFTVREVTFDTICASLCAYLLVALAWGLLYAMVERANPGSFASAAFSPGQGFLSEPGTTPLYFSLVTLSTLGYGDIVPLNPHLRLLVGGEAVFGQVYLAVLVARLVSLQVAPAAARSKA